MQPLDHRQRPRRGRDQLPRPLAEPQRELQHVEGGFAIAPLRDLVAPCGLELRPAQAFRIVGGEHLADRAVRPFQPLSRRDPFRALLQRRGPQQAGLAFHHHLARIVRGFADQRDAAMGAVRPWRDAMHHRPHPFRAGAGLAGAASAQHQPGGPRPAVVAGLAMLLMRMREDRKVMIQPVLRPQARLVQIRLRQSGCGQTLQCGAQARDGIRRRLRADRRHCFH